MNRPDFHTLIDQLWQERYPEQYAAAKKAADELQAAQDALAAAQKAFDAALQSLPGTTDTTVEPWIYYLHKRDGITMEEAREKFAAMMERA